MTTLTRALSQIDGANVPAPTQNGFSANGMEAFASDAAYEAVYTPEAGSMYFNTTECLVREYDGTQWVYAQQAYNATEDAISTGVDQEINTAPYNIVRFTEGSLESIIGLDPSKVKVLFISNEQGGQTITLKNQDGGATAGFGIVTGTGDDLIIEDGQTIPLVYDGDRSLWLVVGGAGGGAGGLSLAVITNASSPVTAEIGTYYLTDTSAGPITVNLPEISTIPGSKLSGATIRFADCAGNWQNNAVSVVSGGSDTQNYPDGTSDTDIDLNVQGQNNEFSVDSATSWCMTANFQPVEAGSGTGTGQGAKNYVLNPDGADGTSDITSDASITVSQTTDTNELPENNTKTTAIKIVQSGGAGGEKVTFGVNAIDVADNGIAGTNFMYIRTLGTYADGDATVRWVDATTGDIFGEQVINTTTKIIRGALLEMVAGNNLAPEIEFNVTDSDGLAVSSVSTLAQNPLVANFNSDFEDVTGSAITYRSGAYGTISSETSKRSRRGDSYEYNCYVRCGTTGAQPFYIELDHQIDVSKLAPLAGSTVFYMTDIRLYRVFNTGADLNDSGQFFIGYVDAANPDRLYFSSDTANASSMQTFNVSTVIGSNDGMMWFGKLPVVGFDSGGLFGSDLEAANSYSEYENIDTPAVGAGTYQLVKYQNKVDDSQDNYNPSTGVWTCPKDGKYSFNMKLQLAAATGLTGAVLKLNDQTGGGSNQLSSNFQNQDLYPTLSDTLKLTEGDQVSFHAYSQNATTVSVGTTAYSRMSVSRVSDKSTTLTGFPLSSQANANKQYLVTDYREDTIALNGNFTTGNLYLTRIGNVVTITEDSIPSHTSNANPASSTGLIPLGFRPIAEIEQQYAYEASGASLIVVRTDGTWTHEYYNTGGASTARGNSGGHIGSISYQTNDA